MVTGMLPNVNHTEQRLIPTPGLAPTRKISSLVFCLKGNSCSRLLGLSWQGHSMDLISSDLLTVEAESTWKLVIWSFLPGMQWGSIAMTGAFLPLTLVFKPKLSNF